jgi:hypothetical protein
MDRQPVPFHKGTKEGHVERADSLVYFAKPKGEVVRLPAIGSVSKLHVSPGT